MASKSSAFSRPTKCSFSSTIVAISRSLFVVNSLRVNARFRRRHGTDERGGLKNHSDSRPNAVQLRFRQASDVRSMNNIEPRSGFTVFINSRKQVFLPMPLGPSSTRIHRARSPDEIMKYLGCSKCSVTPLISTIRPLPFSFTKYRTHLTKRLASPLHRFWQNLTSRLLAML